MRRNRFPSVCVILDGWGLALSGKGNAITQARTPIFHSLWKTYPHTLLHAAGRAVGLPQGLTGNSEVGHINLGAGRIVKQDLLMINEAIEDGTFFQNPVLLSAMHHAKANGSRLHLMGLVSNGGVHSDVRHLYALLELIKKSDIGKEVFIHAFTDGRDTEPRAASRFLRELEQRTREYGIGTLATISGRYYAMDRAHNWDRNKLVYDAIVRGKGERAKTVNETVERAYAAGVSDEFILPTVITKNGRPVGVVHDRDVIIFFNLRSDRARQLTKPFVLHDFSFFKRQGHLEDIFFVGLTNFGDDLPMSIAFPEYRVKNALPEYIGSLGNIRQLYIAEEEKFAHVAYFFHGGSSIPIVNEERIMIPSLKVKTYDKRPVMSAGAVTRTLLAKLKSKKAPDMIVTNFANADMLAHTGNIPATIHGIEYIDQCLGQIAKVVFRMRGSMIVTADHGNAEQMIDPETGGMDTAHNPNPVPLIIAAPRMGKKRLSEGVLGNVAPTWLTALGIDPPADMISKSLL